MFGFEPNGFIHYNEDEVDRMDLKNEFDDNYDSDYEED